MAKYIVKDRETGEILCQGSNMECSAVIGCDYNYVRKLAHNESQGNYNSKYSQYKVEVFGESNGKRGGDHRTDAICCDCGVLMKNVSTKRKRCPECARKRNNRSKAQRMREIRGAVPMSSPIRNPNRKYCEGCAYFFGEYDNNKCCNYIFLRGERRPCLPGKDCTVKVERRKKNAKKERSTDIS